MQVTPGKKLGRKLLKNVEIFYAGRHVDSEGNAHTYTDQDITSAVANFPLLSSGERPILRPPAGIGHDSGKDIPDELLTDAALAAGEVVAVREGQEEIDGEQKAVLFADIEVDSAVADWIEAGYLTRVSAEVLDDPPPEGEATGAKGKTLRRVGLLGYAPPSLKRLKPLPKPQAVATYAERLLKGLKLRRTKTSAAFFCEVCRDTIKHKEGTPMSRDEMLAWLQQNGVDTSMLADPAVPDAVIKLIYDLKNQGANPPAPMSDPNKPGTGGTPPKQVTLKYSEADLARAVAVAIQPIAVKLTTLESQLEADRKNDTSLAVQTRRREVRSFCEAMVKEGRMSPADMDTDKAGNPLPTTDYAALLRMVDSPRVHKFSEAGKTVEKTDLDLEMDRIRARQRRSYSERVAVQKPGHEGASKSALDERLDRYIAKRNKQAAKAS